MVRAMAKFRDHLQVPSQPHLQHNLNTLMHGVNCDYIFIQLLVSCVQYEEL